jgi:ATP-binding cassette, subfamily B, bacterial MsbA
VARERLKTESGTVLTDRGTPLRGGVAEVFAFGNETDKTAYVRDPEYYRMLRRARLNAVRIVCSDPWQRSHGFPHWDMSRDADRQKFFSELDAVVELASQNGLYVLIDYHDIGCLDVELASSFWQYVAPRYANHPGVFYELANEPVAFHPEYYTDEDLRKQEFLYRLVRSLAPDTHLVLLSFANTALALVPEGNPVVEVIQRMEGISWNNASVGIHPYRTLSSGILLAIQDHAPVVITEIDLPVHAGGLPDLYTSIDGAEYGHQVLERLGISWFGWGIEGPEKLEKHFKRGVLEDAKAKNYLWEPESSLPQPFSAGSVVADLFRQPPMKDALRTMGVTYRQLYYCIGLAVFAAILDGLMLLSLLPISTGASIGSFQFLWKNHWLSLLRPHLPPLILTYQGTFICMAVFIFVMGLAKNGANYGLHLYVSHLYRIFSARLANAAFRRYLVFGKAFFDKHGAGTTASILDYNHDLLNLLKKLLELISETSIVSIYLVVMVIISWKLTLVSLMVFPTMHFIRQWIAKKTHKPVEQSQRKTLRVAAKSFEIHRAMPLFRAFTKEEEAASSHAILMEEIRKSEFYVWLFDGLLPRAQEITTLAALLVILLLAFALERGQVSAAKLFVFFFISRMALPRLSVYHEVELEFSKKMPRVEMFLSLFNDNGKYIAGPATREFSGLKDGIYFQKLTFGYPDRDPVLHDVSFQIPKGKVTAIVGPSGSGKTTITNLLLRYYDVAPWTIEIDGLCIRDFQAESLRRNISVVGQEVILLDDTLRANIAFGVDGEVSDTELNRAVEVAALDEVVRSLPLGLDSPVGSDGMTLSGGQRQRVALARAVLKRAPILILDEATSSLDGETEQLVQAALEDAFRGCTTLVISHRMSTIQRADQIVVLEDGRVVEVGSLQELLDRKGRFLKMWETQAFYWENQRTVD